MLFRILPSLIVAGLVGVSAGCARKAEPLPPPPPPVVTVAKPVPHKVQKFLEYNGYLDAVETVQVTARVKGFLRNINFIEGSEVHVDQELYEIDRREYEATLKKAEADRLKAMAELKRATADEDRAKQLLATQAISMEDFQQRVANRESANAVLKQTEAAIETAKLDLEYTKIKAPIEGQINRTLVTKGNLVGQNENTLLTTIVGVKELYVYFDVPERDLIEYQREIRDKAPGAAVGVSYKLRVGLTTEQGYPHPGRIDFRENKVDTGTGTVRLRGRLENPKVGPGNVRMMYPGLYARVQIPIGEPKELLAIPEDALMTGQEGRYVYVLDQSNVVRKRTLKLGPNIWRTPENTEVQLREWTLTNPNPPKNAEPKKESPPAKDAPMAPPSVRSVIAVEEGLKLGDRIIVNGLQRARPGAPVTPEDWDFRGPTKAK